LHILEDGLSPPPGRLATFGGGNYFQVYKSSLFFIFIPSLFLYLCLCLRFILD